MSHILVTGVSGFVGHHLAKVLKDQGHMVVGTGQRPQVDPSLHNLLDHYIAGCDLTNPSDVAKLPLQDLDAIINLAGLAQVGASFGQAETYLRVNVTVHTNLAEAVQNSSKGIRIIAVSTGAVYDSNQPMPLSETSKLVHEGSPYALSKVAMEEALQPYQKAGVDIVIARPFNHIGPGQLEGFLIPDLINQVLHQNTVTAGNLKTERDYTDVRDVVDAYVRLATQPKLSHRIYNVCSGRSLSGQQILNTILDQTHKQGMQVTVDPARIRPTDPAKIVGDNSRLVNDTGWQPTIDLEQTISDYLASASRS